jgi:hypothetical protein
LFIVTATALLQKLSLFDQWAILYFGASKVAGNKFVPYIVWRDRLPN